MNYDFWTVLTCILIPVSIIGTIWLCAPRGTSASARIPTIATGYGPGYVDVSCDAAAQRKLSNYLLGANVKSIVHTGTHKVRIELVSSNIEVARTIFYTINTTEEKDL